MNLNCFSKPAAYHTGPITHLDHLGVLAIELGIPFLSSDPTILPIVQMFYPELSITLIDELESLSYLASHFDTLLGCGRFWTAQLQPEFELLFQKKMRMLFCPHGNSDKGRSLCREDPHPPQDIALLYGRQMYDLWQRTGALDSVRSVLFTGNYRLAYYLKRQSFYETLADNHVFKTLPKNRKTIFYAPSWPDRENPTPFLTICAKMIETLDDRFNLLIKPHPLLLERYPARAYHLFGRFEHHPNVKFVSEFVPVYPLLHRSDLYLGDYSSIGYDALEFDLPLYFLVDDEKTLEGSDLAKAGIVIETHQSDDLFSMIERTLEKNRSDFCEKRKNLRSYAFGRVLEDLR